MALTLIPIPADLTPDQLHLNGIVQRRGRYSYHWTNEIDSGVYTWTPEAIKVDTQYPALIAAIQAAIARATQTEPARAPVLRRIKALARSTVGIDLEDLTNLQIKALLAVLLYDARAIDDNGRIRPLKDWVRRWLDD